MNRHKRRRDEKMARRKEARVVKEADLNSKRLEIFAQQMIGLGELDMAFKARELGRALIGLGMLYGMYQDKLALWGPSWKTEQGKDFAIWATECLDNLQKIMISGTIEALQGVRTAHMEATLMAERLGKVAGMTKHINTFLAQQFGAPQPVTKSGLVLASSMPEGRPH